ncbi:MAG: IS1182 family transposase [Acidobacteria bacterium]|nr:IS1182 family transposase [Acidobacteriota bacterium]
MLTASSEHQASFFDVEFLCESLIPPDSYYRKFREMVWSLLPDEAFAAMYCQDNGRPPIPPRRLAMALLLQFHQDLTDREMERAYMYDLEVKYALGLRLDERPFDHSSLGDFRQRLLAHGKEKLLFETILQTLVDQQLITKDEIQRIDATHIVADVAIPSMVQLVKKGTYHVLKALKTQHPAVYEVLSHQINLNAYTRETVNQESAGRNSDEKRTKKLVEVVREARVVLQHTATLQASPSLRRRIALLQRILQEHIEDTPQGEPKEKEYNQKPPNLLVSPVDEDARYGMKSPTKRFVGYKTTVTETVTSRFITNVEPMRGNQRDGDTAVEAIVDQHALGLHPAKLVGDAAYADGAYRHALAQHGTQLVAPMRPRNTRTRAVYPKSMFHYDPVAQTVTCPQGVITRVSYYDRRKESRVFHFPRTTCNRCPVQRHCTNATDGRRTIGIEPIHQDLLDAEAYNLTPAFKADMKLRPVIEGTHSEMKRYHGLRRARYRGLRKVALQCYLTAAVVNLKRWIKRILESIRPQPAVPMAC